MKDNKNIKKISSSKKIGIYILKKNIIHDLLKELIKNSKLVPSKRIIKVKKNELEPDKKKKKINKKINKNIIKKNKSEKTIHSKKNKNNQKIKHVFNKILNNNLTREKENILDIFKKEKEKIRHTNTTIYKNKKKK